MIFIDFGFYDKKLYIPNTHKHQHTHTQNTCCKMETKKFIMFATSAADITKIPHNNNLVASQQLPMYTYLPPNLYSNNSCNNLTYVLCLVLFCIWRVLVPPNFSVISPHYNHTYIGVVKRARVCVCLMILMWAPCSMSMFWYHGVFSKNNVHNVYCYLDCYRDRINS